jgi:hypothetical protein
MPEQMEQQMGSSADGSPKKPEQSPISYALPLEETVQQSGEGGTHAEAAQIARLLGHNDISKIQEFLDDTDR